MSRITRTLLALGLGALLAPAAAAAAPDFGPALAFDAPIYAASPPRDATRLFVVERAGRVMVVRNGSKLATPFLDISDQVATDGERGLLSIAFPPDYDASGHFYVYMVAAQPLGELQVREYNRSPVSNDLAGSATRIVWSQSHDEASNHNGGTLAFGPDGMLWLATGDGGGGDNQFGHARDLGSQLGKLLRIDPHPGSRGDYTIPPENPFGSAVWAYGLRNPFRFSFDRGSGDLFIGDVGQGAREEVDWAPLAEGLGRGADYGWSCREGAVAGPTACTPGANYLGPILDYAQTGPRAVTGGYVVRDPGLPSLVGRYVYADTYQGVVRSFAPARPASDDRAAGLPQRDMLVSFAEDACGHLYVISLNGTVERVREGAPGPCVLRPDPAPLGGFAPPVPRPPATPAIPDRTSPRVRIALARHGRVGLRATPRIALTASESCRVTVTARVANVKLKRVRTPLRGHRRTILRLRPNAKGVKRIHQALRRHRRRTLVVKVTAKDAAGNTGRVQRRLKVRRG
jgi:Glucose / Sorbosone dehydrogenase